MGKGEKMLEGSGKENFGLGSRIIFVFNGFFVLSLRYFNNLRYDIKLDTPVQWVL